MKHYIIPIFVPHLGCPHDCVFCNQDKITNRKNNNMINYKKVNDKILEYLSYFKKDSFIEIAFYGGSFTAINQNIQENLLEIAYSYKIRGLINEIRLSTRPDYIDKEILSVLKKYKVDTIELGVQSMDKEVLDKSGRGHGTKEVYEASELIKSEGFKLGLQMMLGLPKDNLRKDLITTKEFIKINPECVRIYPTLVIKDTYLEKLYLEGIYKPYSFEEAVNISSIIYMLFKINNINVIRMGLQATDNIKLGVDVISGPFHPSFGQYVKSNITRNAIDCFIENNKLNLKGENIYFYSNKKNISNIVGQKSINIKYLKDNYNISSIKIYGKENGLENELVLKLKQSKKTYKINIDYEWKNYLKKYLNELKDKELIAKKFKLTQ